mgnify:FL=1
MVSEDIEKYLINNTSAEDSLLSELRRETHLKTVYPQMLSGPLQGKGLELFSKMIRPDRILEIGTFTGYSALCLVKGLATGGKMHTIEVDPEMALFAEKYFKKSGRNDQIVLHTGDAMDIIKNLDEQFDLVFIDAGKEQYIDYYNLVFEKVRSGGYIITDNVLWSGKVLLPEGQMDEETKSIASYNRMLAGDDRVEVVMLPLRDGLSIARKIRD